MGIRGAGIVVVALLAVACASPSTAGQGSGPVILAPSVSVSPTSPRTTPSGPLLMGPLPGSAVSEARLLAGGRGLVLADTGLFATSNGGSSWTDETPAGLRASQLAAADVQTLDATHAWLAVPGTNNTGPVTVIAYRRGGAGWQQATATATGLTMSVGLSVRPYLSFTSITDGWLAVAAQDTHTPFGALLHTTDGGATWSVVTSTGTTLPTVGPIDFISPTVGWLTGLDTGDAWMTRDGGRTWTAFTLAAPARQAGDLATLLALPQRSGSRLDTAVHYAQSISGTADGVVLYSSSDNGASWNTVYTVASTSDTDVAFAALAGQDTQILLSLQQDPSVGAARQWTVTLIHNGTPTVASTSTCQPTSSHSRQATPPTCGRSRKATDAPTGRATALPAPACSPPAAPAMPGHSPSSRPSNDQATEIGSEPLRTSAIKRCFCVSTTHHMRCRQMRMFGRRCCREKCRPCHSPGGR
jgi:photosystem II stability/assembly factor-like uncharacterized protein